MTIRREIINTPPYLCKFIGATLNTAWVGLFPISLLNAVHRLQIIRSNAKVNQRFLILTKVALGFICIYCFGFWFSLLTVAEVTYNWESVSWSYGTDSWSITMSTIEFIVCTCCIVLTFFIYLLIALSIYQMRKGIISIKKSERQLLIQATILFVILSSLLFSWHFHHLVLPDTYWTYFSINLYWICYCCLNPVLCIIFSKKIRSSYFRFIGLLPKKQFAVSVLISRRSNLTV